VDIYWSTRGMFDSLMVTVSGQPHESDTSASAQVIQAYVWMSNRLAGS
jgi:hypothetical protein